MSRQAKKQERTTGLIVSAMTSGVLCLPFTGFIYGFLACSDCGSGVSGVLGRIFIGIIHLITTILTLGAPWKDESGSSQTNLRLYVLLAFVLISLLTYLIYWLTVKSKSNES